MFTIIVWLVVLVFVLIIYAMAFLVALSMLRQEDVNIDFKHFKKDLVRHLLIIITLSIVILIPLLCIER